MKKRLLIIVNITIIIILNCSSVLATDDGLTEDVDLLSMLIKALSYLAAFVIVLFLTFYGTKFFAKYSRKIGKSNNIQVVEHFNLGNNNKILVIKIYNKKYILSINNNNTTVIDSFDIDASNENQEKISDKMDFEKHLETVLNTQEGKSINSRLLNMKMKVMKLKNKHHEEEMDIKEEEYEEEY